jgi:MSHA biogenesis protein MshE
MLEITNTVAEADNQADPAIFLTAATRQMAGNTLRRQAINLVTQGRTTVLEAMRISNQFDD